MTTPALRHLAGELDALARAGRLRHRTKSMPRTSLSLSSNDYLGYARADDDHVGAAASRLIAGTFPEHDALEEAIAGWLGTEDALLFTSGYAANVGLLSALVGPDDLVVSDALNHASIIDGCRLARSRTVVVPHADLDAVARALAGHPAARRRWVVTESYFSMDGDVPDLAGLRRVCDAADAGLLVDEAHALGVLGPGGRGICADRGVVPDARVGTFGKAFGGQGAFVAGSRELVAWLWNRARSFVFSTAMSPRLAAGDLAGLERAIGDDVSRARLAQVADRLRSALREAGYDVPRSSIGPIIPVIVGGEAETVRLARSLAERGIEVVAIRPPTVPAGTSRLRVTVHAGLTDAEVTRAIEAFVAVRTGP